MSSQERDACATVEERQRRVSISFERGADSASPIKDHSNREAWHIVATDVNPE